MSNCPTCKKPNCGNWAACARRRKLDATDAALDYEARLVWYGIGVAEALFQDLSRSRDIRFLIHLELDGPAALRRAFFVGALKALDETEKGRKVR